MKCPVGTTAATTDVWNFVRASRVVKWLEVERNLVVSCVSGDVGMADHAFDDEIW